MINNNTKQQTEIIDSVNLRVSRFIDESTQLLDGLKNDRQLAYIIERLALTINQKHKIFACGNGGSASQAEHFVAELVGRFQKNRDPISAISLCSNNSTLTAIANDYSFSETFSRQLQCLSLAGDTLVVFSTSGNSQNIIKAVEIAKKRNVFTIGISGRDGGGLNEICDELLIIPSFNTARIQEMHLFVIHTICELLESKIGA